MAYKRLDGKKVGKGIAIAAGLYLLWGLFNGSFDGGDAPAIEAGSTAPPEGYMGGLEDTPAWTPEPSAIPEPVVTAPEPAPAQPPQAAPPAATATPVVAAPSPTPTAAATPQASNMPAGSGILEWFKGLTPGAQNTLAKGVAGGAAGLMAALAQRNALKEAEEREDRAKEDRRRRGEIPAIGSGFISRTRGA